MYLTTRVLTTPQMIWPLSSMTPWQEALPMTLPDRKYTALTITPGDPLFSCSVSWMARTPSWTETMSSWSHTMRWFWLSRRTACARTTRPLRLPAYITPARLPRAMWLWWTWVPGLSPHWSRRSRPASMVPK